MGELRRQPVGDEVDGAGPAQPRLRGRGRPLGPAGVPALQEARQGEPLLAPGRGELAPSAASAGNVQPRWQGAHPGETSATSGQAPQARRGSSPAAGDILYMWISTTWGGMTG